MGQGDLGSPCLLRAPPCLAWKSSQAQLRKEWDPSLPPQSLWKPSHSGLMALQLLATCTSSKVDMLNLQALLCVLSAPRPLSSSEMLHCGHELEIANGQ